MSLSLSFPIYKLGVGVPAIFLVYKESIQPGAATRKCLVVAS